MHCHHTSLRRPFYAKAEAALALASSPGTCLPAPEVQLLPVWPAARLLALPVGAPAALNAERAAGARLSPSSLQLVTGPCASVSTPWSRPTPPAAGTAPHRGSEQAAPSTLHGPHGPPLRPDKACQAGLAWRSRPFSTVPSPQKPPQECLRFFHLTWESQATATSEGERFETSLQWSVLERGIPGCGPCVPSAAPAGALSWEPPLLPRSQSMIFASAHGGSRLLMTLTTGEPRQTQLKSFCYCPSPASSWSRRQRPHRAVAPAAGAHLRLACRGRCPSAVPPRMVSPPAAAPAAWAHGDRSSGLPAATVGSRACGRAGSLVRNCSVSTEKMVPLVGSPACLPPPQPGTGLPEGRSPGHPQPTTSNASGQGNWVVG